MKLIKLFFTIVLVVFISGCNKSNPTSSSVPEVPTIPELCFPQNQSVDVSNMTVLSWFKSENASSYSMQLAKDSLFNEIVIEQNPIPQASIQLSNLLFNTPYYWRVRAYNENVPSEWSAINEFQTKAEQVIVTFNTTFGNGVDNNYGEIIKTDDDCFVIVGRSNYYAIWLFKIDKRGNLLWEKEYTKSKLTYGNSVVQTEDGGYMVLGTTTITTTNGNAILLIRTDAVGDTLWTKIYDTENRDYGKKIIRNSAGNYVILGREDKDSKIIIINSDGNIMSTVYVYDLNNTVSAHTIMEFSSGEYISAGSSSNFEYGNAFIFKTDNQWVTWSKKYSDGGISCLVRNNDFGYTIAGTITGESSGNWDGWIMKINENGQKIFERNYDGGGSGATSRSDSFYSLALTESDGYVITGRKRTDDKGFDIWLVKTDMYGDMLYEKTFGGYNSDYASDILILEDGYLLAGVSAINGLDEIIVIKTDFLGNIN